MTIKHILSPKEKDLGGFSVRRILPSIQKQMVGPWIFFDHMGPATFSAGKGIDVRPHPHINLATVTYLFEGETFHRDSLGNAQSIYPGDINLMVAGKGIVHSERERTEIRNSEHSIHGLQLWHALPKADEEIEPAFYHYAAEELPKFSQNQISGRVLMGSAYDCTSPVKTFASTLYVEAFLKTGGQLAFPKATEKAIYVASGSVQIAGQNIPQYSMALLEDDAEGFVEANNDAQIAIIGGEKMGQRFIEWNFVSSRKERIEKAKDDWRNKRFPIVPGDEKEFIPLP